MLGLVYDRAATKYRSFYSDHPNYNSGQVYQDVISRDRYGTADAGVIQVPGAEYDVGVYQVPGQPGKCCLIYDQFLDGGGIERHIGKGLVALKERYGATVASRQLKKQGFVVREERAATGRLRLVATKRRF